MLLFFLALNFFEFESPVFFKEFEMFDFLTESFLTFLVVGLHFLDNVFVNGLDFHLFLMLKLIFIVFNLISSCEL